MKISVRLLWGLCVLLAAESISTSLSENRTVTIPVEGNSTTTQSAVANDHPSHTPTEDTSTAAALTTKAASATQKMNTTHGLSRIIRATLTPTREDAAKRMETRSAAAAPAESETSHSSPTTRLMKITGTKAQTSTIKRSTQAQAQLSSLKTTAWPKPQSATEEASSNFAAKSSTVKITTECQSSAATAAAGGAGKALTASEKHMSLDATTTDSVAHGGNHFRQSSPSSFTAGSASVAMETEAAVSEATSEAPIAASSDKSTHDTSDFAGHFNNGTNSSLTSTTVPLPSQPSIISELTFTTQSLETARSTASSSQAANSTPANSTGPVWPLAPGKTENLPILSTTPTLATPVPPCKPSGDSGNKQALPCSTRGVVKQCLIVIASLALLATIFMVSTIALCAKLSVRRYKVRRPQEATEMMCISSLLPESNVAYARHRNPISNGVLVFPVSADSDDELGDNLTLSSFLPENDRSV